MQILGPKRLNRALGRNLLDKGGAIDLFSSASLDLRFALQKTLDPRVTFTRASSGTFVGSDGLIQSAAVDTPRFDHNPTTGESLGLLVEEARTNLSLRSQELDNAAWTKTASSITANAVAAPDGTTTAGKLVEDSSTGSHNIIEAATITYTSGVAYTFSFFVKKAERQTVQILMHPNPFPGTVAQRTAVFNSNTGAFVSIGSAYTGSSVTALPDSWYRVSVSSTADATSTGNFAVTLCSDDTGTTSYTGDGTSGILLWGAQLEAGAFATSYIPTTTATVTRAADVASITGSNFSSWYRQDEGTIFVEGATSASTASPILFQADDGTANERIQVRRNGTTNASSLLVTDGGTTQANFSVTGYNANTIGKTCAVYSLNDFQLSFNGTLGTADTSGTLPTVDRAFIGSASSPVYANGPIKRLTYWPTRLGTLQAISQP
jgi:hypothetical protein